MAYFFSRGWLAQRNLYAPWCEPCLWLLCLKIVYLPIYTPTLLRAYEKNVFDDSQGPWLLQVHLLFKVFSSTIVYIWFSI